MSEKISIHLLAQKLGISAEAVKERLALLGWAKIASQAERIAHIKRFDGSRNESFGLLPNEDDWIEAANELIMPIIPATRKKQVAKKAETGILYVLYDGITMMSKIGCTSKKDGSRQQQIMSSNGNVLINVVNAEVHDHYKTETQIHQKFDHKRLNGEWFKVDLVELVTFIHDEIDWISIDFECLGRTTQYLSASKLEDVDMQRKSLYRDPKKTRKSRGANSSD